jgi:hypothetical protein
MYPIESHVHFLPVIVVAIIHMVIGFLWYGPVFGKHWMILMGFSKEKMEEAKKNGGKGMTKNYIIAFLGALVTVYVLARFVSLAGAYTIIQGVKVGFWAWLGFVATVGLGMVLWEGRAWKLYAFNMGYHLVVLVVAGGIFAMWR